MRLTKKLNQNLGLLLLGLWLIVTGLATFVPAIRALGPIPSIVAIAAGVLLLLAR